jgi:hypothetical protein
MKSLFICLMFVAMAPALRAQSAFAISYPVGFSFGALNDYIDQTSFRGINMEFLQRLDNKWLLGIESGWNVFYKRESEKEYKQGTASITGTQFRYANIVPILAEAKFIRPLENRTASFYGGLGIGTVYVDQSTDFGLYTLRLDAWQFCLRPEAGFYYIIYPGARLFLGAKYYAGFKTDDMGAQSFLTANIGFIFSKYYGFE